MSEGIDIVRQRIAEEAVAKTGFLHLGLENLPDELSALDHLQALSRGSVYRSGSGDGFVAESDITPNS
ncbi:MAG: hypothetical protein ACR2RE_22595, partial [Geminicoccaceae bacterium]